MRNIRLLLLATAATIAGFLGAASQAQAAPVSLTFDNGRMTIGELFKDSVVIPASDTFPSDDLPLPQRTDIQLLGDLTDGNITIPASTNTGLQFPYMHLMHPIEQGLRIPITARLNEPGLTGTWNAETGAMTLEGELDFVVVTGTGTGFPLPDSLIDAALPPLSLFARCRMDNVPVNFSTGITRPIKGQAFTGGFGVGGALTTKWNRLPASVSENGGECDQLNALLNVEGGLWLSNGVVEPAPQPGPPEPTCETDIRRCPLPRFTEIDNVRLTPKKKMVKAGRKIMLTVRVHNSGNKVAVRQPVKIRSTNPNFRVPAKVRLNVPARGTGKTRIPVRALGKARGRAVITAVSNGWSGKSRLTVKPKHRNRR